MGFSIELLKFEVKTSANISAFFFEDFHRNWCLGKLRQFQILICQSGFRIFAFLKKKKVAFSFYCRLLLDQYADSVGWKVVTT